MHSLSTNVLLKKNQSKSSNIFLCRKIFQQPSSIRRLVIIFGDIRQVLISTVLPPHVVVQIVSASYLYNGRLSAQIHASTKKATRSINTCQTPISYCLYNWQPPTAMPIPGLLFIPFWKRPTRFPKTGKFNKYHINETISYQKLYLKNEKDLLIMFSSTYAPGHNSSMRSLWLSAACSAVLSTVKLLNYNLCDIFQCH